VNLYTAHEQHCHSALQDAAVSIVTKKKYIERNLYPTLAWYFKRIQKHTQRPVRRAGVHCSSWMYFEFDIRTRRNAPTYYRFAIRNMWSVYANKSTACTTPQALPFTRWTKNWGKFNSLYDNTNTWQLY